MYVQNVMVIHPVVLEMFQSKLKLVPTDRYFYPYSHATNMAEKNNDEGSFIIKL